jgi:hypothetical protein
MLMHPDLMLALVNDRRRELIAEADRTRLLNGGREARRARRARDARPTRQASVVRGQPAGTLASCEPSAAVPAR